MKTIYKYPLDIADAQRVAMPKGAQILTAQIQKDSLFLWALVDNAAHLELRTILIRGTGNNADDIGCYISTVQLHAGLLVLHVFEGKAEK